MYIISRIKSQWHVMISTRWKPWWSHEVHGQGIEMKGIDQTRACDNVTTGIYVQFGDGRELKIDSAGVY